MILGIESENIAQLMSLKFSRFFTAQISQIEHYYQSKPFIFKKNIHFLWIKGNAKIK